MLTEVDKAQGRISLLEADPGMAEGLSPEQELEARERLHVNTLEIEKGDWDPPLEGDGNLGYVLLQGFLMREAIVGESRSVELLNIGDLIRPWQEDPSSFSASRWWALEDSTLAVLDDDSIVGICAYPPMLHLIAERAMTRSRNLAVHWAIANTVGLEKRILMLFRHLAERRGRVTPDGVALPLRLTHQMVADLVGARRPSATTAIVALADQGLLSRTPDGGWLITTDAAAAQSE